MTIFRKWGKSWRRTAVLDTATVSGQMLCKIPRGGWLNPTQYITESAWLERQSQAAKQIALRVDQREERSRQILVSLKEGPKTTAQLQTLTGLHWYPLAGLLLHLRLSRSRSRGDRYYTWSLPHA